MPPSFHPDTRTSPPAPVAIDLTASRFAGLAVHFTGIGGCGMSGLARVLRRLGATCTGSDRVGSDVTERLAADGFPVTLEQTARSLPEQCDLLVASAAIGSDHPEIIAAQARGIETIGYAEALGLVQSERTGVSIAGTHGKSTTAAMLCHVLLECGIDPGFIIGATCGQIGGGSRVGSDVVPGDGPYAGAPGLLIAEACEFNRSFHRHNPTIGLINNIEEDHLDIYESLDHIVEAFGTFAHRLPSDDKGGFLLIAHEGAHRRAVTAGLACSVRTFGFNPAADFQVFADPAARRVGILQGGVWLTQWTNSMVGEHNALNAAAAAVLANQLGADWEAIAAALQGFRGLDRRMQRLGSAPARDGAVTVYDDYGHHPTEIDSTLRALRIAERPERLICVFQPHQHSRTRFFMEEFAQSFSAADVVIVPHIYFVRDSAKERHRVRASDLVDRLRERGIAAMHLYPFDAIVEQLRLLCRAGDLLVIMGAGPVGRIAHDYMDAAGEAIPAAASKVVD
ncbi:MAG: UDP-N-acetylmuramate--L-alanine ligase [Planctomycetota bacterium]|jgi:UDP-N-acetylmuramate--alanine ligase